MCAFFRLQECTQSKWKPIMCVLSLKFYFVSFRLARTLSNRTNKDETNTRIKKTLCFDCICSLLTNHFAVIRVHTASAHNNNRSFDQPQPVYNNVHAYKYTHTTRDRAKEKHTKMMIKNSHHDYQIIVFLFCRFFSAD